MALPASVRIQQVLWGLESGAGPRILKLFCVVLGYILVAFWFDSRSSHTFTNPEAMEAAHIARNISAKRGYVTYSIRPSVVGLLQRADTNGAAAVLKNPVPDLSVPPGYPLVLSLLMKMPHLNFSVNRASAWNFEPELVIVIFNEALFFACIVLVFLLARKMFDAEVGWVSAMVFAGSGIYWGFCVSGLSTICLVMTVLLLAWCLVQMEAGKGGENAPTSSRPLLWAGAAGALIGLGGLTRYSFAWLIVPLLVYLGLFFDKRRWAMMAAAAAACLFFLMPWIARNVVLSHTIFGTAGYAMVENTRPYEMDRVERAFDPYSAGLSELTLREVGQKFLGNMRGIVQDELPRLGGSWMWAFFLCGLLLPFGNPSLQRLRYFTAVSLGLLAVVQAFTETHVSAEWPEYNTENLLVLLGPLVVIFGTGFFFVLLDQIHVPTVQLRQTAAGLFALVMGAPLLLGLLGPRQFAYNSPYSPYRVQQTASLMKPDELMMSDIPWAVAWYGDRPCAWLTLNDGPEFKRMNELKRVGAVYLTQRTTDQPFLTQLQDNPQDWDRFLLDSLPPEHWAMGIVPREFPLTNAPHGYQPAQLFLSDTVRWKVGNRN